LLLSVIGGAAGLVLGWWALQAVGYLGLDRLPRGSEIAMDVRAVLYMLALVVAVGLVVAVLPVLALRKARLSEILREGRMDTGSRRVRLVRRVLVTTQVAFALVLLAGAGLLLASFERVLAVDTGFRSDRVLTGSVSLPVSRYAEEADLRAAQARILEAVRAVPGVQSAGLTTSIPFGGSYSASVILAEGYQPAPGESLAAPHRLTLSDGYLEAMGMQLVAGRSFEPRDTEGTPRTVLVDERLARKFWPGADPLGRRLYFPGGTDDIMRPPPEEEWLTVVGVVRPIKLTSLTHDGLTGPSGAYFLPAGHFPPRTFTLAIRTASAPEQVTGAARAAIASIDPELPFFNVLTMEERVDRALVDRRTPMLLAVGFAVVALFLSAIGLYGTLSHQVSQRRREIGIRMALGAAAPSIFGMVLREGAVVVGVGTVFGLTGAFLLRQTLESQLFGVGALDPAVLSTVASVLVVIALAACLVPARVAARTDPLQALGE
jgi:predicted permease